MFATPGLRARAASNTNAERGENMKMDKERILAAALAMLVLAGASGSSFAKLSPQQASLSGVGAMTVHTSCSQDAAEIGFNEEDIRKDIQRQLENAGIEVRPPQMWGTLPGRCRLRVAIKVYKPAHHEILVYNLKMDFLQTVTLERNPQTRIDAATWERMWFAHGSENRLAQAIPQNLRVLTASFIKDYRQANPRSDKTSDVKGSDNPSTALRQHPKSNPGSVTSNYELTGSKSSDVFHKSDCRSVSSISSENLVSYKTREEAILAGKRPCKWCNP